MNGAESWWESTSHLEDSGYRCQQGFLYFEGDDPT